VPQEQFTAHYVFSEQAMSLKKLILDLIPQEKKIVILSLRRQQ